MNKTELWNLFKLTGNLNYYLKYKEMIDRGLDKIGDNEGKRNNN